MANSVYAMCIDGKIRLATYRHAGGNDGFVRIVAPNSFPRQEKTITGKIERVFTTTQPHYGYTFRADKTLKNASLIKPPPTVRMDTVDDEQVKLNARWANDLTFPE